MSVATDNFAYVILVNDDNSMTVTNKKRIIQRSKLVDTLWFLVNPEYNGHNMSDFTAILEYVSPTSRKYRTELLVKNEDAYNGYLKYTLPFDTNITAEAGKVELLLSFLFVDIDEYGNSTQRVRKITGVTIDVIPILAWSDIIPDDALSALDQRIIKTDAQIKALNDLSETLHMTKADDLDYDENNNELQLMASGKEIGRKITINTTTASIKDGVPVVDFGSVSDIIPDPDDDDVIEF